MHAAPAPEKALDDDPLAALDAALIDATRTEGEPLIGDREG
jgi:hypothetical protein